MCFHTFVSSNQHVSLTMLVQCNAMACMLPIVVYVKKACDVKWAYFQKNISPKIFKNFYENAISYFYKWIKFNFRKKIFSKKLIIKILEKNFCGDEFAGIFIEKCWNSSPQLLIKMQFRTFLNEYSLVLIITFIFKSRKWKFSTKNFCGKKFERIFKKKCWKFFVEMNLREFS